MTSQLDAARKIVFLVHYFPPINSAGAKRVEALSKYFTRAGRQVTVVTTAKSAGDGAFTEKAPDGVTVHELRGSGRIVSPRPATAMAAPSAKPSPSGQADFVRRLKNWMMRWFGQLPDPRLPFAFAMLSPFLASEVRKALREADVIVGSTPPWSMLLATLFAKWRFRRPVVLDYRDHFSQCHEMLGSAPAKWLETVLDRALARRADRLITVSQPMLQYYKEFNPSVAVVMNGYDPEIVDKARAAVAWSPRPADQALTVRYLGVVTPDRVPRSLLGALHAIAEQAPIDASRLRFEFYGECSLVQRALADEFPAVAPLFHFFPAVPYIRALELTITSDYLLFAETSFRKTLSAQGILTTKLFEYLACGRPIIADIDPSTLAGQLIQKTGDRHFVSNSAAAFQHRLQAESFWTPPPSFDHPFITTLSRASQARQYLKELDGLLSNTTPGSSAATARQSPNTFN